MSHIPEPWFVQGKSLGNEIVVSVKDGSAVCLVIEGETAEADARRIVACVNACAGIEQSTLELVGNWSEAGQSTLRELAQLRKQRDERMAGMRKIAGMPCASLRARAMSKVACEAISSAKRAEIGAVDCGNCPRTDGCSRDCMKGGAA